MVFIMTNRSKKVSLSARIPSFLKSSLDMYATASKTKTVELIENALNNMLDNCFVVSPSDKTKNVHIFQVASSIWTEDELVYKLRLGLLGPEYAGELIWRASLTAVDEYPGEFSLRPPEGNQPWLSLLENKVNIDLIKENWNTLIEYREFLEKNAPFHINYKEYKEKITK